MNIKELLSRFSSGRSVFERDPRLGPQEVRDKRYDALVRQRTKQLMDEHAKVLEKQIVDHQRMMASRQLFGDGPGVLGKKQVQKKDMEFYNKGNLLR